MTLVFHHVRRRRGFTLMELLIAVAIFGIVLAAINTVFYTALRLRNRFTNSIEEQLPIQHTTDVIQRDLASLVSPSTNATPDSTNIAYFGPLTTGVTSSGVGGQGGGQSQGMSQAQPNVTEFYVTSGRIDESFPWGDMQKISYVLMQPTNRTDLPGMDLFRSVTRNLAPASSDDQPELQYLMSGVETINYSYWDGTGWQDTWDTTQVSLTTGMSNTLPRAIKVQIQLATADRGAQPKPPIEMVIPILIQTRTNSMVSTN